MSETTDRRIAESLEKIAIYLERLTEISVQQADRPRGTVERVDISDWQARVDRLGVIEGKQ